MLLSFRRDAGVLFLRLHQMFLHAPDKVVTALAKNLKRRGRAAEGEATNTAATSNGSSDGTSGASLA